MLSSDVIWLRHEASQSIRSAHQTCHSASPTFVCQCVFNMLSLQVNTNRNHRAMESFRHE